MSPEDGISGGVTPSVKIDGDTESSLDRVARHDLSNMQRNIYVPLGVSTRSRFNAAGTTAWVE